MAEGKKMRLSVIIIIILVSMALIGIGSYFFVTKILYPEQNKANVPKQTLGPTQPMGEFIVNLADVGSRRYVKAKIVIELSNEKAQKEASTKEPQIRDNIINIFRSKTFDEISRKDSMAILKDEMMNSINSFMTQGKVVNIFFTDFAVQ